jgi:hypothetical protein
VLNAARYGAVDCALAKSGYGFRLSIPINEMWVLQRNGCKEWLTKYKKIIGQKL